MTDSHVPPEAAFDVFTRRIFDCLIEWCDPQRMFDVASPFRWRFEELDEIAAAAKLVKFRNAVAFFSPIASDSDNVRAAYDLSIRDSRFDMDTVREISDRLGAHGDNVSLGRSAYMRVWDALRVWSEAVMVVVEQESHRNGKLLTKPALSNYRSLLSLAVRDVAIAQVEPSPGQSPRELWADLTRSRITRLSAGPLACARPRSRAAKPCHVTPAAEPARVQNDSTTVSKVNFKGERYALRASRDLDEHEVRDLAHEFAQLMRHTYRDVDVDEILRDAFTR